jgi:site-specific DNA-methyltransferase (adenine-specific)
MAIALRLAGFDQHPFLAWIFGSGFPKAANLSKAIDKAAGVEREVVGPNLNARHGRVGCSTYQRGNDACENPDITAPSTDAAKQWDGWYYGKQSLKPAMEPILMFQKPPEGRMVDNVQKWGCGGLNIDGSRVGTEERINGSASSNDIYGQFKGDGRTALGRFPANLILSYPEDEYDADGNLLPNPGKDEVLAGFPQTSSWAIKREVEGYGSDSMFLNGRSGPSNQHGDSGSAARFYYCAKASKTDRTHGNSHPCVKPIDLMRYLIRLVCPPGGTVLDPFNGSGATTYAAREEGCKAIGIELSEEYCAIAKKRLKQGVLDLS